MLPLLSCLFLSVFNYYAPSDLISYSIPIAIIINMHIEIAIRINGGICGGENYHFFVS